MDTDPAVTGTLSTDRPLRVLVVDEEEPITHILTLALEMEDWEVSVAHSAADAISSDFDPDIVLLDMMLPDRLGTDVVAELRRSGSRAHVIFLTGRDDRDDRIAAYTAGGDGYLTKPFGVEEVVDHLEVHRRQLGLAPSSRRVDDLVLDVQEGAAWRGADRLPLSSLELALLRELVERRDERMTAGELVRAAAAHGISVPLAMTDRLLERLRAVVNDFGSTLVTVDERGWAIGATD
jgi:two-component system, OmpR family, response regulator